MTLISDLAAGIAFAIFLYVLAWIFPIACVVLGHSPAVCGM